MQRRFLAGFIAVVIVALLAFSWITPAAANKLQVSTQMAPTVTGTYAGLMVTVTSEEAQVNLRSGPNTIYPKVGVLLAGQTVPAKGRSPGGDWIQVVYPGTPSGVAWVASRLLSIPPGNLPVADVPPTPGPQMTQTIDPTLASQLLTTPVPTRLATFTPPPPLVIPTLPSAAQLGGSTSIPMGMVIVSLAALGVFLGLISLLRGR